MMFSKVLLVNPPYSGMRVNAVFSAGLGYVAGSLKAAGVAYDVCDMSLGYSYAQLCQKIKSFGPELIGVSVMTYRFKETYALIKRIKNDFLDIKITVGGPHMSLFRSQVLEECSAIDYGIVLEGEESICELCRNGVDDNTKGIVFHRDGRVYDPGDRPFIKDLDAIPFPTYERFELERYINKDVNALPIVSSRGCPFDCIYCPVKCAIGRQFRTRSPENILKEITYWHERGYRAFSFADDNFTLLKERVYQLCALIEKSGFKDLRLSCDNGVRADRVDSDLLKTMKSVGFYRIAFGVEAGCDKVLKALKKKEDIATIKRAIQAACDLGFDVDLFFLVGSPEETRKDLESSFKIAMSYPIGTAYFYNIIPFPHTELYEWIKTHGRFLQEPSDYLNDYPILDNRPVFETPSMPEHERQKALRDAFGVMRMTMRRAWARRLWRLGFFGKFLAYLYCSSVVQDQLLRSRFFRKLIYWAARHAASSK